MCAVETSAGRVPPSKKQQGNMSKGRRAKKVVDVDSAMKKGNHLPSYPIPPKKVNRSSLVVYVCYTIKQQLLLTMENLTFSIRGERCAAVL